ncbi:type IV secretory pathway VirB10-like protein [Nitrobacter vulgaris]|uniref:cell envelope integrity protein TolA n=1 Tax=Nitrobacter vulgaris TaxID=29421 RepID=UPI00285954C9|nr:cell envelope integrity protein TolA [Nitrobacter vulgaris]MDR6306148.1 type IV secretory pathway VirB10-like protein [Nitrobacter vulgaris]
MVSTARIFFAGVATSAILVGVGFSGGILLGRAALEPVHPTKTDQPRLAKRSLPTARVVLPAPMEIADNPPATATAPHIQLENPETSEPQKTSSGEQPHVASEKTNQARMQGLKNAEQAEQMAKVEKKKAEAIHQRRRAAASDRHRRYAERKARQEAASEQQAQEQRHQEERQALNKQAGPFGLLAFGDGIEVPRQASFFGN